MNRVTLTAGRWIHDAGSNEVIVNEAFAKARKLAPGSRVVALLNGKREELSIVGIALSPEYIFPGRGGLADERSFGVFWMGRQRLAGAFNMEGAFNVVAARLAAGASEDVVLHALDAVFEPYGSRGAHGRDEQFSHRALTQEINEQKVFGTVLPSVLLAVAVFLLNVVLTRQIGIQRTQIAALKALGYPDFRIGVHYLQFVLAIVAAGIAIGIGLGAWLGGLMTDLYAAFFRFPAPAHSIAPWIVTTAAGAAIVGAVVGAIKAVHGVVTLQPAEAMRPPAPPVFRATLAERLGLGRVYSARVRMVLRELERRPLRAAMTTIGVASAVAILISGTWWRDAIDHLLDVDFRLRERQHVSLAFIEPVSSAAVYDVARLPGVLRVETGLESAVRLRNGHRSYRTTLAGVTDGSEMQLIVDAALKAARVPASGLVVNARLAKRLGLRVGDRVEVEFLEGARRHVPLQVAGIVAELAEMRGYMAAGALAPLLGHGDAITSARIRLDLSQRTAFLAAVKETPRIAAALELEPVVQQVRETSARFILVFTTILSAFASIIAVGVVYNNARIALAERSWELASLRVLGFTQGEVSGLLLGELALCLIAALPLGWIAGYWLSYGIVALIQAETFQIPFVIQPRTYAFAALITAAAAVVSALIVRRRIDTMDLSEVLKARE
jgi:putative ABC transport system permease protein